MPSHPFQQPGRFWRGNLHTHSNRSDGRLTPEAVCAFYQSMNYDFVAITDHFMEQYRYPLTDTRPFNSSGFVTLLGAELHAGTTRTGELWHLLAVGLPHDFAPNLPDEDGPAIAARALATGAFVAAAHPAWYNLTEEDVLDLGAIHAIETINGISADHNDRLDSWYMLDTLLARGHRYLGLATDDSHFHDRHNDLLRGWVWVKSETLSPQAILTALKAGHYYNSSGPQIYDIHINGLKIAIRCSPVNSIFITGKGPRAVFKHGNGMIEAELDLDRLDGSPYCRITVRDAHGGRAWTNPIWFE
ncbi:MAG: CehA/McbA family metallohydrolase [Aggregatilineales bacterium]